MPEVVADGLEAGTCASCGETFRGFPRWDELGRLVAQAVIAKPSRLTPGEVRFLRSSLGMKAQALAATLGVSAVQISRWETGAQPISALADRLLRLVVATREGLPSPDLAAIDHRRAAGAALPLALRLRLGRGGWRVVPNPRRAAA
jgi:DNA-binding transcriptional regulator YiaG